MITRWLQRLHCLHHDPANRQTFIHSTWHRTHNHTVHYYRCDRCGHTWRQT